MLFLNAFGSISKELKSFSSDHDFTKSISNSSSNVLNSASGRNHLDPGGPAPYNGRILILNFIIPVTDVGSYFIDDQFPIIVNAYDELNNLVGTDSSDGSNSGFDSWHIGYSPGISSVEMVGGYWSYPNSPDGWGIDDLAFSQIPEPATMVLLGLGGLALRISKRRP